jgi:hypothetical protein
MPLMAGGRDSGNTYAFIAAANSDNLDTSHALVGHALIVKGPTIRP